MRHTFRVLTMALAALVASLALLCATMDSAVLAGHASSPPASLARPDAACATCHAAIYASYERTAMARGSGAAMDGLLPGEFYHDASAVSYRIFTRDGRAWMSYTRSAAGARAPLERASLEGKQELLYYVGSGRHGRTFLYKLGEQWFELPVNFYGRRGRWDMAPAFESVTAMPSPLPVDANCLHCHASEGETPLPEARNRFPQRPFDEAGIGCSACHGDPAQHLAANGHGPIVNPDKLPVAARDSACIQCHLEGDAVVYRAGRSLAQFRAGDTLSDFAVYFVRRTQAAGGRRASSQYEALLQSACKRASGDALTCTSCHNPHRDPEPAERVAYFRARCLTCHTAPAMATSHHPEQPDCATCHMPSRATADISHEQVTDHNIQRHPVLDRQAGSGPRVGEQLLPVGSADAGDREFGLAYAQLAQKGDTLAGERAAELLSRAEAAGATDEPVHTMLGFLRQRAGDLPGARMEYAAALREDPFSPSALTNRAVLDATSGDLNEALRLLDRLVKVDPTQTQAGLDLAFLQCRIGQATESRALAERLQGFDPDSPALRLFLTKRVLGGQSCSASTTPR